MSWEPGPVSGAPLSPITVIPVTARAGSASAGTPGSSAASRCCRPPMASGHRPLPAVFLHRARSARTSGTGTGCACSASGVTVSVVVPPPALYTVAETMGAESSATAPAAGSTRGRGMPRPPKPTAAPGGSRSGGGQAWVVSGTRVRRCVTAPSVRRPSSAWRSWRSAPCASTGAAGRRSPFFSLALTVNFVLPLPIDALPICVNFVLPLFWANRVTLPPDVEDGWPITPLTVSLPFLTVDLLEADGHDVARDGDVLGACSWRS